MRIDDPAPHPHLLEMKAKELRDMPNDELLEQIATLRKDLFGLHFANATGELEDTAGVGRTKRDLARALTVAHERELTVARRDNPGHH